MTNLASFGRDNHSCGYCGYNPQDGEEHYCDGFGHSIDAITGEVDGSGCRDCQTNHFCEKKWNLEHPGEPLPEPVNADGTPYVPQSRPTRH